MAKSGRVSPYPRATVICDPDKYVLAARALKWMLDHPDEEYAIIAFGNGPNEIVFRVERYKSSISVAQSAEFGDEMRPLGGPNEKCD